jgi:hypothetical protein
MAGPIFWKYVAPIPEADGCWEWYGDCHGKGGYGRAWDGEKRVLAHRLSYVLDKKEKNEAIPEDFPALCILHKCDNVTCVNPAHLLLGTFAENNADMARKGRASRSKAKLTDDQVRELRRRREGGDTYSTLATAYGLSVHSIPAIIYGRSYATVGG